MLMNLNYLWCELIVEELIRIGIDTFSISPGSRNTPLTLSIAKHPKARSIMHFDERGAAYYALGYGRAKGKPAVFACTSGTAVANAAPAVNEASVDGVPLLILTADRPFELLDAGDRQTIDQVKIFGSAVRHYIPIPTPSANVPPEAVLTAIDSAVNLTGGERPGPVHINCQFRDPLHPHPKQDCPSDYEKTIAHWRRGETPYTRYISAKPRAAAETIEEVADAISHSKNGLVVIGRLESAEEGQAARALAHRIGWPAFADITSGIRLTAGEAPFVPHYDQLLHRTDLFEEKFDCILHIGSQIISKRLMQYLTSCHPASRIQVLNHPCRKDPDHRVTMRITADLSRFCRDLYEKLEPQEPSKRCRILRGCSKVLEEMIQEEAESGLSEVGTACALAKLTSKGHALFLASSMAIRHVDMFAGADCRIGYVGCNRGASGIDGTIASACGYAEGLRMPVTLLLGDLAALHDLNSLAYLAKQKYPITIVTVNNDGGGIFRFLPIANYQEFYVDYIETPHELTFAKAAEMFHIPYYSPTTWKGFAEVYTEAMAGNQSVFIEVMSDSTANHALHQKIKQRILTESIQQHDYQGHLI